MATFTTRQTAHRPGARDAGRAWLALATVPVAIALAFGVGEGLSALAGYPPGGDATPPWWVMVGAATPALIVAAVPAVVARRLAGRAAAAGDRRGLIPARIAVAGTSLFILTNLVAAIWG